MSQGWLLLVDLLGTFAFALSGATASIERRLDWFGVAVIAYLTACGGGILRDLCLGLAPPVALTQARYLAVTLLAAAMSMWTQGLIRRLRHPVLVFDAIGLGFFAVVGAHKALTLTGDVETAIILGVVTAVGGGVLRDVLLNRVPVILQREIYALAALLGATVQVAGERASGNPLLAAVAGVIACAALRFLAMRFGWQLPLSQRGGRG